ncbi:MAG: GNAT family N-acetyltransferase [Phycisphaerales bacterium]
MTQPARTPAASQPETGVVVRRLLPTDSFADITALLHRAYAKQIAQGMKPLAGRQGEHVTRERATNSECWVATIADGGTERIAGVILLDEQEQATMPPLFRQPTVSHFAQFGVDPLVQGRGIGRLLLEVVERRAREKGATQIALSMAEPDTGLKDFYSKRGYQLVEYWQWPYTNYRSCILSKAL